MEFLWRIVPSVRRRERGRFAFLFLLGGALALAQTLGQTTAESVFLARLGASALPAAFLLASVVTALGSLLYALRVGRASNDRVLIELLGAAAVLVGVAGAAVYAGATWAPLALLCAWFLAQAVVQNHYFALTGDFFDTLAAKRVAPAFTAALSLGSAAGAALALTLVRRGLAPALLVLVWVGVLLGVAAAVALSRPLLLRWRPIDEAEEDPLSVVGIRISARYLRRAQLGRWLVVATLAIVSAGFVARFLYSDVLARAFPDEAQLAAFLATYLGATNLLELALPLWISPWLVRRWGVTGANLLHPALTVASFLGLVVSDRLPAALGARATGELLEGSFAAPMRSLLCNALPERLRERASAFLEGVVVHVGLSMAGGVLLLVGHVRADALALAGAGLAGVALLAQLRVRREYTRALAAELRAGRLDLRDVKGDLGQRDVSELALLWARLLDEEESARPSRALLELAPLLAERGFDAPLRDGLSHPSARVRAACLAALAGAADVPRLAHGLLDDPDPAVRAEAAALARGPDEARLAEMARSLDPALAVAALAKLPEPDAAIALARCVDPNPHVRAAALERVARLPGAGGAPAAMLVAQLAHPDARVRRAAVSALARVDGVDAERALASALADGARVVRESAAEALAARGANGARVAREVVSAGDPAALEGALTVLGASVQPDDRARVVTELRRQVREAWLATLALPHLPPEGATPLRFLRLACTDAVTRSLRIAFHAIAILEDDTVVRSVERTLRLGAARPGARIDALEVLSNLGDRVSAHWLVLLLEPVRLEEKIPVVAAWVGPPRDLDDVLARASRAASPWMRAGARAFVAKDGPPAPPVPASFSPAVEVPMDQLLLLRRISLFGQLGLEQLEAVQRITREVQYVAGEAILREGEAGDDLYLLVDGEAEAWRMAGTPSAVRLSTVTPGSALGEMAVLDGEPRSATVIATRDSRLLVLEGRRLRELVIERPEMAFEIFRVLCGRVRVAESRIA
jgi:HEAT repeat protein